MDHMKRIELAKQHLEMLDSKTFNDPRSVAMRALICHYQYGKPAIQTVLAVAKECGVADFEVFKGLDRVE